MNELIQIEPNNQIEYLSQVLETESALYELNLLKKRLVQKEQFIKNQIPQFEKKIEELKEKIETKIYPPSSFFDFIPGFFGGLIFWALVIGAILLIPLFIMFAMGEKRAGTAVTFTLWGYLIAVIVLSIFFGISNIDDQKKEYVNALERKEGYKENILELENSIKESNQEILECGNTIDRTQEEIENMEAIRNNLYSYPFLHSKYHDFVTVAQLLFYIQSGQCHSLYGADGALRMFEQDLLQERIISNLEVIITQLEEVKRNQGIIVDAINQVNENVEKVLNSVEANFNDLGLNLAEIQYFVEKSAQEERLQNSFLLWDQLSKNS